MSKHKLNHEAWARSMIGFIRDRGLESEFQDWCGGWPCCVASPDHHPAATGLGEWGEYAAQRTIATAHDIINSSAQQAAGEAVAWMYEKGDRTCIWRERAGPGEMCHAPGWTETPLYAAPQPEAPAEVQRGVDLDELLSRLGLVLTDDPDFDHDEASFEKAKAGLTAALATPQQGQEVAQSEAWRGIEIGTGWIVWDGVKVPSEDGRDSRKGFVWFLHETEQQALDRGVSEIFYWPWFGEDEKPCVRAYKFAGESQ